MLSATWQARRGELHAYFDRTAVEAWQRLTSDAPVNRIRATVRAGRDAMRRQLLDWLPADLTGRRLLDAGCGTGALAVAAAERGAEVVGIDLSPTLIAQARQRAAAGCAASRVVFAVGDMLDPAFGRFDHVVAMDSLIHYRPEDIAAALAGLGARAETSVLFTFVPRTPALAAMHAVGGLFPRSDRAPAVEPVAARRMARLIADNPGLAPWRTGRTQRVANGFYISQALELVPA
jgi:magnesium-protoporphyrin O-methyltransferase